MFWNSLTLTPSLCRAWRELVLWSQCVTAEAVLSDSESETGCGVVQWRTGSRGASSFPGHKRELLAQKPGIVVYSLYKWSVQNSTCFQEGVFMLHQITLCYEYVLITFTPLHFSKCKGIYFVIGREVPFLRLTSFCHMVILFFTPSLFHNFSLEILLTAVQFLLTCVHNVLGRAGILYILTIILVGFSHGVEREGGIYWTTNVHIHMKQETLVMGIASCLPFCCIKESVE